LGRDRGVVRNCRATLGPGSRARKKAERTHLQKVDRGFLGEHESGRGSSKGNRVFSQFVENLVHKGRDGAGRGDTKTELGN